MMEKKDRSKSHVKPLLLDARGKPVLSPPLNSQFAGERREQYQKDRMEVMLSLDPKQWRVFALRWGLTPPPKGWDDHEMIINMMHRVRLEIDGMPHIEKHKSAIHCTSMGLPLPLGMTLINGELAYAQKAKEEKDAGQP